MQHTFSSPDDACAQLMGRMVSKDYGVHERSHTEHHLWQTGGTPPTSPHGPRTPRTPHAILATDPVFTPSSITSSSSSPHAGGSSSGHSPAAVQPAGLKAPFTDSASNKPDSADPFSVMSPRSSKPGEGLAAQGLVQMTGDDAVWPAADQSLPSEDAATALQFDMDLAPPPTPGKTFHTQDQQQQRQQGRHLAASEGKAAAGVKGAGPGQQSVAASGAVAAIAATVQHRQRPPPL